MSGKSIKKQNERIFDWPMDSYRIILRNMPDDRVIKSASKDGKYVAAHRIHPEVQLVISYNYEKQVFIVWNGAVHHYLHNHSGKSTFSMGADAKETISDGFDLNRIQCVYKDIRQPHWENCVELVVIVGKDALLDFCKSYESYIFPDVSTIPEGKDCLFATPLSQIERVRREDSVENGLIRKRERVSRLKRDADFRERVIDRWQGKCIVCGVTEKRILEAAHKESVRSGGSDDPENGYCLCANHHRMYDSALLDIDLGTGTFVCHSQAVEKTPWYMSAMQRGFKLYLPKHKEK